MGKSPCMGTDPQALRKSIDAGLFFESRKGFLQHPQCLSGSLDPGNQLRSCFCFCTLWQVMFSKRALTNWGDLLISVISGCAGIRLMGDWLADITEMHKEGSQPWEHIIGPLSHSKTKQKTKGWKGRCLGISVGIMCSKAGVACTYVRAMMGAGGREPGCGKNIPRFMWGAWSEQGLSYTGQEGQP